MNSTKTKGISTKTIALTGILLAICIVFQFFKGISPFISGPVVNACIIIATLAAGLASGVIISILTPVIAYFIGATPILSVIPLMLPVIMVGNAILAVGAWLFQKNKASFIRGSILLVISGILKAVFLGCMVIFVMLPIFGSNIPEPKQAAMKTMFSSTQLITAMIGIVIALAVWKLIPASLKNQSN